MADEDQRTIWCGNLSERTTEEILYELFLQGGPVQRVNIPKDRDGRQKSFGFVTYKHKCSVPYALNLFDGTTLFNRLLNLKSRNANSEMSQQQNQMSHMQHQQQNQMPYIQKQQYQQYQQQNIQALQMSVLSGNVSTYGLSMMSGTMPYPGQNLPYSQNSKISQEYGRHNRHHRTSHHPYHDDNNHERRNHRTDAYNRESKHSSHRHSHQSHSRNDRHEKYERSERYDRNDRHERDERGDRRRRYH
ncbi:hypothetical protein TKK_0015101 [Trichogramma kaykai]|uniref:RRM domain-containing protein n=1 Tax=Trichogramma kaykai TaxID=54128 RepID=A0ABD2WBG0_9HYME